MWAPFRASPVVVEGCGVCMELFLDGEGLSGALLFLFLIVDVAGGRLDETEEYYPCSGRVYPHLVTSI